MLRTQVQSSNLRSIGYDAETQTLEIEFTSGGVYQYYGVSSATFQGLMNAASHGTYFHQHIKNNYSYHRIN